MNHKNISHPEQEQLNGQILTGLLQAESDSFITLQEVQRLTGVPLPKVVNSLRYLDTALPFKRFPNLVLHSQPFAGVSIRETNNERTPEQHFEPHQNMVSDVITPVVRKILNSVIKWGTLTQADALQLLFEKNGQFISIRDICSQTKISVSCILNTLEKLHKVHAFDGFQIELIVSEINKSPSIARAIHQQKI